MFGRLRLFVVLPLLIAGMLVPKVSALALHLNPNIMAIVICTGSELVTIHIGPDGTPIEAEDTLLSPCVMADPNDVSAPAYARWTQAPRSYQVSFSDIRRPNPTEAELGLLPDLRGPPFVI